MAFALSVSLVGVGFGLLPNGHLQWIMMTCEFPALFLTILTLSLAAGRAGCCSYPLFSCCSEKKSIFHDQPIAKCAHAMMIPALILLGINVPFQSSAMICLWWEYDPAGVCTFYALWTFLAHCLALTSTILFCKNEKERPKKAAQWPVQGGVQMQAVQTATAASVGVQPVTVMQQNVQGLNSTV
jgi:hypothetical protein